MKLCPIVLICAPCQWQHRLWKPMTFTQASLWGPINWETGSGLWYFGTPFEFYWFAGGTGGLGVGLFSWEGLVLLPLLVVYIIPYLSLFCLILATMAIMAYMSPAPAFVPHGWSTIMLLLVLVLWLILLGHIIIIVLVMIWIFPPTPIWAGWFWVIQPSPLLQFWPPPWAWFPILAPTWALLVLANLYLAFQALHSEIQVLTSFVRAPIVTWLLTRVQHSPQVLRVGPPGPMQRPPYHSPAVISISRHVHPHSLKLPS